MPWVAAAGAVAGGLISAYGARSAASTQAEAGQQAIAGQERMLASQQTIQQPYVAAGLTALQQLLAGTAEGGQFTKQFQMRELPTTQPYVAGESQAQQFATKEALAAMQNQMSLGGQSLSTNATIGAGKLAGDIGAQYEQQGYNQWLQSNQLGFNQALAAQDQAANIFQMNQSQLLQPLQYLTNVGQAAASGQAANIGAAGSNIANLQTGIGNVQAAGQIGAANAYGGIAQSLGQYGQYYMGR